MKGDSWIWLLGGAALLYYFSQQQAGAAGTASALTSTTPTPYSIYPELAYMTQTSMASTPTQQASTAVQPTSLYTFTQQQATAALESQCAGSYPGCTPMLGDTQLGL